MGVGLVVTDANHVDSMMVEDYSLDCAWGKDENDFELTVDKLIRRARSSIWRSPSAAG